MLWVAAVLAFVGRMPQLGWAIIVVVLVNAGFSFAQEYRAERASRALAALLPQAVTIVRGGRKMQAPAEDLVPGDVVVLHEGDRIPADCRIVRSEGLKVNLVFAGTFVVAGSARKAFVRRQTRMRGVVEHGSGDITSITLSSRSRLPRAPHRPDVG
jgi:cation transport ATPase